jgi:hypothetical protein
MIQYSQADFQTFSENEIIIGDERHGGAQER